MPYGAKVNWSFCDEQDIDSNPSDFEYERSYGSPNTTASDSRGSTFGSPDSYESCDVVRQGQYHPYSAHVDNIPSQARFGHSVESSKYDANGFVFGSGEVTNALHYASRFASYAPTYISSETTATSFVNQKLSNGEGAIVVEGICKRAFDDRKSAVAKFENDDTSIQFSTETAPQLTVQHVEALKRARTPSSVCTVDTTAGSRSYRQQTSELINKLDKLLKFPSKPGSISAAGNKAARGSGGKGRSRRPPRDLAKPRARNVVLKQAAELIWRIKCDEQVNLNL